MTTETTKYCTFWYPTIFHSPLKALKNIKSKKLYADITDGITHKIKDNITGEIKEIITDKDGNIILKRTVELKLDGNENLEIITAVNDEVEYEVKLFRTPENHNNGFAQYYFDTTGIKDYTEFETILTNAIYHLAKQFYHVHEADTDKDSAIKAIITDRETRMDKADNIFIIGFLKNFANVFKRYAESISFSNAEIDQAQEQFEEMESKIKNLENTISERKPNTEVSNALENCLKRQKAERDKLFKEIASMCISLSKTCENSLIEYTYCKTLLSSKYNKSSHHEVLAVHLKNPKKDENRKLALNIRNSIRYIENIKYKNQNRLGQLSMLLVDSVNNTTTRIDKVLENSKRSEKLSFILAGYSVFLALFLGLKSEILPLCLKDIFDTIQPYIVVVGTILFGVFYWRFSRKK